MFKHIRKYILTVALLLGGVASFAQTYNNGTWYSLYNTTAYSASTSSTSGVTIHTYENSFVPNAGTYSFSSKLPGSSSATKTNTSSSCSDPKDYGVTSPYTIKFGGQSTSVDLDVSSSYSKTKGLIYYTHTYTYTYNYKAVSGSGLNSEATSFDAKYVYVLKNTLKTVYIKDVKVPMAKHIRLTGGTYGTTSVSKDFGSIEWGETSAAQTVNFRSFLTSGNITVKLTSGDANVWRLGSASNTTDSITSSKDGYTYAIGANKFAYNGSGACDASNAATKGKASVYDFVVYFCPQTVANYSGTITITDGVSTATVTLSGKGIKQTPSIDECRTLSATTVSYGDALTTVTTGGVAKGKQGQTVEGTWSASPSVIDGCTDNYTFTFVPTNTALYNTTNNGTAITCNFALDMTKFVKLPQTITWAQSGLNIGDLELNGTTSGHDATVYYTSSDESVATISGTTLHMVKPGFVTITAHADATCNYLAAEDVSHDFELSRTRPTVTPDVVNLTYGDALSSVTPTYTATYNGETVEGSFAWVNDALQPEVGTSTQSAVFTPDDDSRFSAVTVDVTVVVGKADTDLKWRIGATLREYTSYSNPVSTNNSEAAISITTDNELVTYDSTNDMLIVSGPVTEKIVVKITVSQAATTHYKKASKLYSINVMPKSPVCVDKVDDGNNQWHVDINDENTFNDALAETDGTVVWQESTSTGSGKYLGFNVTYSQYKGIELGNWQEGLSVNSLGSMSDNGVYTQKSVILSITGVPDRVSFSTRVQDVHVKAVFTFDYWASNRHWELFESADMTTWTSVKAWQHTDESTAAYSVSEQLNPTTRYIKITYKGNFTGTVQDLRITRRHGFEVGADRNQVATTAIPYFGTEAHPLQVPQTITFRYYSLGSCGSTGDSIAVSSDNENIYADVEGISRNVDFDQYGTYELTVRVTDVNQIGTVTLQATDGASLSIAVASVKPEITATTGIFHTGTEQNQKVAGDCYRGMQLLDFSKCFSGSTPLFDTLYIFGVTGNTELVRNKFDYTDPVLKYDQPRVNTVSAVDTCNAHTPCFVYYKSGNQYLYKRTISNITTSAIGYMSSPVSVALLGYAPYVATPLISFSGTAAQQTDLTLINTEIAARPHTLKGTTTAPQTQAITLSHSENSSPYSGSIIQIESESNTSSQPFTLALHTIGTNQLTATEGHSFTFCWEGSQVAEQVPQPCAPIALHTASIDRYASLTIDDMSAGVSEDGSIELIASAGAPSIDLGTARNSCIINGSTIRLHNATGSARLAASYRQIDFSKDGEGVTIYGIGEEQYDGHISFVDGGTILYDDVLRLPVGARISGATFNSGDVLAYNSQTSNGASPLSVTGIPVSRKTVFREDIPAEYGTNCLHSDDEGRYHPLLAGDATREDEVSTWLAAMPENAANVKQAVSERLLFMQVTDETTEQENLSNSWQTIASSSDYVVADNLVMLMQVSKADEWRIFVAPFDISRVYVLELDETATRGKRDAVLTSQNKAANNLRQYLQNYITGSAIVNLPIQTLISKYIEEHPSLNAGIYPLVHYNGSNMVRSNYYLYEIGNPTDTWTIEDGVLQPNWQPVTAAADGSEVIMESGRAYAMDFFYCPSCASTSYDYWSGKLIVLEGYGPQTISSAATVSSNLSLSSQDGNSSQARITGNTAFSSVTNPAGSSSSYVYNPQTDIFEQTTNTISLQPTESILYTNISTRSGARARAIARTGQVLFEDPAAGIYTGIEEETDEQTDEQTRQRNETIQKILVDGEVCIIKDGKVYNILGQEK